MTTIAPISSIQRNGDPGQKMFQTRLFSKIVPNRRRLDIIKFEQFIDTTEEHATLDAIEAAPA